MADKEILDALESIFNSATYRPLTLREITEQLQRKGLYKDIELHKAMARVNGHLCEDRTSANYPFLEFEGGEEVLWGLETWFPPKLSRAIRSPVRSVEPLSSAWETQHTISVGGHELTAGTFPLRQHFDRFVASMDKQQREHSLIVVHCYGSEQFLCSLNYDDRTLEGKALQYWYNENDVQPGDTMWLSVEATIPLVLRIYTEWDRDADVYRRYVQRRQLERSLPRINLPIRDLVWLYFKQHQKVAHPTDVAKAVLADRPEISGRSVYSCLVANPHLFARTGERGTWGLKEWGIEQVTISVTQKSDELPTTTDTDRPTAATYPLDYVLNVIHGEDLVYKILQSAKAPLSYPELTERIGKYLRVNKSVLERTSFLNVDDARLVRLHDGAFAVREDLEEVIRKLTEKEKELKQSLDKATEDYDHEIGRLKEELASTVARYEWEMGGAHAEVTSLTRELTELIEQLDTHRSENQAQVNGLEQQISQLERHLAEATTRMDETLARLSEVEQERDEARRFAQHLLRTDRTSFIGLPPQHR